MKQGDSKDFTQDFNEYGSFQHDRKEGMKLFMCLMKFSQSFLRVVIWSSDHGHLPQQENKVLKTVNL